MWDNRENTLICPVEKTNIGKKQRKIPKNRKERPSSAAAFLSARVLALQSGASHSEEFRVAYTLTEFFLFFLFALYPNVRLCSNKCIMSTTSVER